jgi:hypothetical protein
MGLRWGFNICGHPGTPWDIILPGLQPEIKANP